MIWTCDKCGEEVESNTYHICGQEGQIGLLEITTDETQTRMVEALQRIEVSLKRIADLLEELVKLG